VPKIPFFVAALGLVVGAASLPAKAMVCNIVFDRNDQVIYRDTKPPLDLSDAGSRARAAMRQRGEYLMVIDTDRCLQVAPTAAGSGTSSVEDIVAGMRPYLGRSGGRVAAGGAAAGGVGTGVPSAPPAAVSSSRASSTRAY
jgi:hypothetical protein